MRYSTFHTYRYRHFVAFPARGMLEKGRRAYTSVPSMRSLVLIIGFLTCTRSVHLGRPSKRVRDDRSAASSSTSTAQLVRSVCEVLQLTTPPHVYSMGIEGAYETMIDYLWTGEPTTHRLRADSRMRIRRWSTSLRLNRLMMKYHGQTTFAVEREA